MRIAVRKCCITPLKPCMQCGYVQRDHAYEKVHDDIYATVFVVTLQTGKVVWIGGDSTGFGNDVVARITELSAAAGIALSPENFIIGASHDHSAPVTELHNAFFGEGDPEYVEHLSSVLAAAVIDAWKEEGQEAVVKYSFLYVDGLYSNRNDANKLSDKKVSLLGFFHDDKLISVFCTLACHNTVLGPKNYELTGDLFGALRTRLEKHFGCPVLMAQGTAGDMGNRQYRTGQEFSDLERMAGSLSEQIIRKMRPWETFQLEHMQYKHVVYKETVTYDSSIYKEKIKEFNKRLETVTDYTEKKVLLSGIAGFQFKISLGDGEKLVEMPADIYTFEDLQIVSVPGELGSILGLTIKAACQKKHCLVWCYTGSCHLGYMVDKEAYRMECQETNTTIYPEGMPERFAEAIIENMK